MYDIHTHLYWKSYDPDRDAVIERARAVGVEKMFVIGCTVEESRQAVELAEQYENVYAAVGIHPHEMSHLMESPKSKSQMPNKAQIEEWLTDLRELAKHEKVVAIGECGLEYYVHKPITDNQKPITITEEQKQIQKEGFLAQIELARELSLPLIVHCRASTGSDDAYRDLLEILTNNLKPITNNEAPEGNASKELSVIGNGLSVILHCYMGDTEVTKEFLKLPNVYFSFTGNITYPVKKSVIGTKDDLTETVRLVPLDRLFTETDCPFLTPQSKRGERNEPVYVAEVVAKVAELQGKSTLEVDRALADNFQRVFHTVE